MCQILRPAQGWSPTRPTHQPRLITPPHFPLLLLGVGAWCVLKMMPKKGLGEGGKRGGKRGGKKGKKRGDFENFAHLVGLRRQSLPLEVPRGRGVPPAPP